MGRISVPRLSIIFGGFLAISYTVCVLYDLAVPAKYEMYTAWQGWLPGFDSIGWQNYAIGLVEVIFYGIYAAFLLVLLQKLVAPAHAAGKEA